MQPMKSRVLRGPSLNLVARSFGYNVNPVSDYGGIRARENVEVDEWVQHHAPGSTKISGFANGIFRQHLAGQSRIDRASPHHGLSNAISCTNPGIHQFTRGLRMICGLCLKEDDLSKGPSRTLSNKLWRSGALVDEGLGFRKGELRWEFEPRIVVFRGTVRSLYTEIKGDKRGDEKSEDIAKLRRVRSPVKVKASTSKRKRIVRVASTSIPRRPAIDLEVANDMSIREKDMHCLPASSAGLEFESQAYREEELERVGAHVSLELDHDDVEENHNSLGARGQIVQKPLPSLGFQNVTVKEDEEIRRRSSFQAMALLRAALDEADEEEGKVAEEFQRSLRVGIVGAPNAGKSLLTNQLVGTRVSAVSRKTNTTHREHLGVFTKGDTQLLYYDTPGLHLDIEGSPLRVDAQHRVRNAWEIVDFCEALVVLVDAERQIRRPDKRVQRLVEKLGKEENDFQKRVLVLNKVDIIEQKRLLLPLAKQFEDLLGFDRIFMISGLTGSGVKDVKDYLVNQAVLRPWDEDPELKDHRDVALEVVREQVFEHLHEELPHTTRQKIVSWKVLKDGSIRIQQLLLVAKKEHQKILVGKNGAVIGDIGIKARKELTNILGATVHLILDVKLMTGMTVNE